MVGVFLAPDGNNKAQVEKMTTKAISAGEKNKFSNLERNSAWTALQSTTMKSLQYPLPALTLSSTECTKIMWNALKRVLPKCGINRRIPRSILYGSTSRQGFGVKDLHLLQGIHHITDIVDHSYKKSITGHLIQDSLEHLKLELGMNGSIFEKKV